MDETKTRLEDRFSGNQPPQINDLHRNHGHQLQSANTEVHLHSHGHRQPLDPMQATTLIFNDSHLINRPKFGMFASELLGTFLFVYLSQLALASFELMGTQNDTINRQVATALASGLALLFASALTLGLSGAHLNPAYTLASATFGRLAWRRAPSYLAAQYTGAFLAAAVLHATYSDKLGQRHIEGLLMGANYSLRAHGNLLSTGKFFSSYPPTEVSLAQLFISYTLAAAMLVLILVAVHESRPLRLSRSARPAYLAAALILVQASFGANGGPALNPAQDFAPRMYIALAGWGAAAFNLYHYRYWWLCGIVAPHMGAMIGFALHRVFVHLVEVQDKPHRSHGCHAACQCDYRPVRDPAHY